MRTDHFFISIRARLRMAGQVGCVWTSSLPASNILLMTFADSIARRSNGGLTNVNAVLSSITSTTSKKQSGSTLQSSHKKDREAFRSSLVNIIMQVPKFFKPLWRALEFHLFYMVHFCYFRQNERTKQLPSTDSELPPLSRTGSPTATEKDILVCAYSSLY